MTSTSRVWAPRRARSRPDAVLADRGYATTVTRRHLPEGGIKAVVPESMAAAQPANVKAARVGSRPPLTPRLQGRNVVERAFTLAKQWRGLATRYDKLAVAYRRAVVLCAVLTWLNVLGDMP